MFDLRVDAPDDIVRIATFLTTALIVTALMGKLRARERRFRRFVDHASDAFLLDGELTVLDINKRACASLSYSREELIGMHPRDFDSGLDDTSIQRLQERIAAGETVTFETLHRRKDGTSFPVEIRAVQFDQGGRRLLCLVRDITERKRAEDELRTSEARFRHWQVNQCRNVSRRSAGEIKVSCGSTGTGLLSPDSERLGLSTPIPGRSYEMAPWSKVTVDHGVGREKPLCLV